MGRISRLLLFASISVFPVTILCAEVEPDDTNNIATIAIHLKDYDPIPEDTANLKRARTWDQPNLTKTTSPAIKEALKSPEALWNFITSPETSFTERMAAATQARTVMPPEWGVKVMLTIDELQKEDGLHKWRIRTSYNDQYSFAYSSLKDVTLQRERNVLGHKWVIPFSTTGYPFSWAEKSNAPWPWQAAQALYTLVQAIRPFENDEVGANRWLSAAMQMPTSTDEEAILFIKTTEYVKRKPPEVMARLRSIALSETLPFSSRVATECIANSMLWDSDTNRDIAQVILTDILQKSPYEMTKHEVFRSLWNVKVQARVDRKGPQADPNFIPATLLIAASDMTLRPIPQGEKEQEETQKATYTVFCVCQAVDDPPFQPSPDMIGMSGQKALGLLASFKTWYEKKRPLWLQLAEQEKPRLDAARAELERLASQPSKPADTPVTPGDQFIF